MPIRVGVCQCQFQSQYSPLFDCRGVHSSSSISCFTKAISICSQYAAQARNRTNTVVFQELAGIVIVLSSWEKYSKCPPISKRESFFVVAPIGDCFVSNSYLLSSNNTCAKPALHDYCGEEDDLFLWSLVSGFIRIIAYHLVFMTALEFISAQAPLKMKGIIISFWYALSAQRYLVQAVIVVYINKEKVWLIFHGVKVFVILISLFLYCCLAKRYRYRLRDEVVNEHYLVEEIYDRELRMAEEYEREKKEMMRAFYGPPVDRRSVNYGTVAINYED